MFEKLILLIFIAIDIFSMFFLCADALQRLNAMNITGIISGIVCIVAAGWRLKGLEKN